ncbi:MAG: DNA polymerase I [Planctomycetes bacterium]|nr:DNA polymerase I [Planctomycetota bacterium]MBI3844556.1 DNA polymerase I [Planctomycetota bacterium]
MKRLFLIDGSALVYRSHFAFIRNPLLNSRGENTSAVFGFATALLRLLDDEKPEAMAVVFDTPEPTFRHRRYAEYKATRQKMPAELAARLPDVRDVTRALGIVVLESPGYEADDVIGTLARRAENEGFDTYVVSGDKDLLQLVTDRVRMYSPGRADSPARVLGPAEVEAEIGVAPERVADVLALMGDASDNIPGVPGIGEKTAVKLVRDLGGLESVLERAGEIDRAATRDALVKSADQARLSRELATIDVNVPLGVDLAALTIGARDVAALRTFFQRFEFKALLDALPVSSGDGQATRYVTVRTREDLDRLAAALEAAPSFAVDTETTGIDPLRADLVGLSFSIEPHAAFYVPVNSKTGLFESQGGPGETTLILDALRPALENGAIRKTGQNIKYDLLVLDRHGVKLGGVAFDTMIAAYLLDPGARQHNLDVLALEYLGFKKTPTEALIGRGAKQITMADVAVDEVAKYACEDADVTRQLEGVLAPKLRDLGLESLFHDMEMPLVAVLAAMERTGIALDLSILQRMSRDLSTRIGTLEAEVHALAGTPFNINSPQQLGAILFEKLRIQDALSVKRLRRTKTGYSTDQQTLEKFAEHPIVEKILEWRQTMKLKGTYVDALPALVNPRTGRVHTSFNQTVAATGRLSSSDPNLQNIPIRTDVGREIRKAFVAGEPGWQLLSADYSQIELRLLAHVSGDPALAEAFRTGEDVHRRTAARMFGLEPSDVPPELRSRAKVINFGIVYGMTPAGLAMATKISLAEAEAFIRAYFELYPGVKRYIDETIAAARRDGYVSTILHRRRAIPEITSSDVRVRNMAENIAVNMPIQGAAADLIKIAMIRIHARLDRDAFRARMLLQVHDELLFEAPEDELPALRALVKQEMEGALELRVPIVVEVKSGRSWFEAH